MDKKKRILFVINHMNIGGIQTALLQLLKEINGAYEVDLLCINPNGELLGELPEGTNLIQPSIALTISECDLVSSAKLRFSSKDNFARTLNCASFVFTLNLIISISSPFC